MSKFRRRITRGKFQDGTLEGERLIRCNRSNLDIGVYDQ